MNEPKKKKHNARETKALIPFMKRFNKAAKLLIDNLTKEISKREENLKKINVVLQDTIPVGQRNSNISIQTVDLKTIKVNKKGEGSYEQNINWEEDFKNKNRGIIL